MPRGVPGTTAKGIRRTWKKRKLSSSPFDDNLAENGNVHSAITENISHMQMETHHPPDAASIDDAPSGNDGDREESDRNHHECRNRENGQEVQTCSGNRAGELHAADDEISSIVLMHHPSIEDTGLNLRQIPVQGCVTFANRDNDAAAECGEDVTLCAHQNHRNDEEEEGWFMAAGAHTNESPTTDLVGQGTTLSEVQEVADSSQEANSTLQGDNLICHWQVLVPVIHTLGTLSLKRNQYRYVVTLCTLFNKISSPAWKDRGYTSIDHSIEPNGDRSSSSSDDDNIKTKKASVRVFPCSRTLLRSFLPFVQTTLIARSNDKSHNVDHSKAGVPNSLVSISTERTPMTPVRVIPVSEYARMDIGHGPVFDAIKSTSLDSFISCPTYPEEVLRVLRSPSVPGFRSWDCIYD